MRFRNFITRVARPAALAAGFASAAGLFAAALLASGPAAAEFSRDQKSEIGKIVHDYLIANPEVIKEAVEELEKRHQKEIVASGEKAIASSASVLFESPRQSVVGNPQGDVTIVEFFDYNCIYCKKALDTVAKLVETDPKIKVILKDFPILGPDSIESATVAAALRDQFKGQKYWDFHRKLLGARGHVGKAQALAIAKEMGADMDRLDKSMKSPEIEEGFKEVTKLADDLHFGGTPSWVIANEPVYGDMKLSEMKQRIDNFRKCGKTAC